MPFHPPPPVQELGALAKVPGVQTAELLHVDPFAPSDRVSEALAVHMAPATVPASAPSAVQLPDLGLGAASGSSNTPTPGHPR